MSQTAWEPGHCWFCKTSPSVEERAAGVSLYSDVTPVGNGRVSWKTHSVQVPRCERCWKVHELRSSFGCTGALLGGGLFVVVAVYLVITRGFHGTVREFVAGIGLGLLTALAAGALGKSVSRLFTPFSVRGTGHAEVHPAVLERLAKGWKVGTRPPGAA